MAAHTGIGNFLVTRIWIYVGSNSRTDLFVDNIFIGDKREDDDVIRGKVFVTKPWFNNNDVHKTTFTP